MYIVIATTLIAVFMLAGSICIISKSGATEGICDYGYKGD